MTSTVPAPSARMRKEPKPYWLLRSLHRPEIVSLHAHLHEECLLVRLVLLRINRIPSSTPPCTVSIASTQLAFSFSLWSQSSPAATWASPLASSNGNAVQSADFSTKPHRSTMANSES